LIKAPKVSTELDCKIEFTILDNSEFNPLSIKKTTFLIIQKPQKEEEVSQHPESNIELLERYTIKLNATNSNSTQGSTQPPYVVRQKGNIGGQVIIDFNIGLTFIEQVLSLNSTNDGPVFFSVKLVINPINIERIAASKPSARRALEATDLYEFGWSLVRTNIQEQIQFKFTFENP